MLWDCRTSHDSGKRQSNVLDRPIEKKKKKEEKRARKLNANQQNILVYFVCKCIECSM